MKTLLLSSLLLLLSFVPVAVAQPTQNLKISFAWNHDGKNVFGFRIYKGPSPGALVKVVDIPGAAARSYDYNGNDVLPICFGLSAVGSAGESDIVTKDDAGVDVCLGKPGAPTNFSFSVR